MECNITVLVNNNAYTNLNNIIYTRNCRFRYRRLLLQCRATHFIIEDVKKYIKNLNYTILYHKDTGSYRHHPCFIFCIKHEYVTLKLCAKDGKVSIGLRFDASNRVIIAL